MLCDHGHLAVQLDTKQWLASMHARRSAATRLHQPHHQH
jgi:hypothetical protein